MILWRLCTLFLILFWSATGTAQIKVNVSSPLMPGINLNGKERVFKTQFKKLKKDSLQAIEDRINTLEDQIDKLKRMDSLDNAEDTANANDSSMYSLDSLQEAIISSESLMKRLGYEIDSLNQVKGFISWDSLREAYVASQMKEFFQSKGYLPPAATSDDPLKDLRNNMQNDLPGMHLNPESFKSKEALAEEAARQLVKLKSKYLKVNDIRYPEQGVEQPKPYNSFTDRLIFGGQIDISLSRKPNIDVKPNVGFIVSKRVRLLVDYSANYFMKPKLIFIERNTTRHQTIGTLLDVDITRGFFLRGKAEKTLGAPVQNVQDVNYLLGVGKTLTLYKNLKAQLVLSHSFKPNENGKRWFLEYGIQQRGISDLFKKKGD